MIDDSTGPKPQAQEPVAIGVVRKPHGIRGQCAVSGFGATLAKLTPPLKLRLGRDAQTAREITVIEIRETPKGFTCTFDGCNDMDSAEGFRDQLLFCDSGDLPELDDKTHYGFELEGLTVVAHEDNGVIGTVTAVESYPTVDCIEVRRDDGTVVVIAMTPGVVKTVDKRSGTITVSRSAIQELLG
jgi:16S rRNA processing protein RimM